MKLFKNCAHVGLCIALAAVTVWAVGSTAALIYVIIKAASA